MKCTSPLEAYRGLSGKIVFDASKAVTKINLKLPCGQCLGCRIRRSAEWAARCYHEAAMHEKNCFLTLTYHDRYLPKDGSLDHRDFQLFMKRFRKSISPTRVRYFMCGEYGSELGRPHFHALIFGYDFDDQVLWKKNKKGQPINISGKLSTLWGNGISTVQELNYETAQYTAQYVTKKITGELAETHYQKVDPETGEVINLKPEYARMSTDGGIGKRWLDEYAWSDVLHSDDVPVRTSKGFCVKPVPRYYDKVNYKDNKEGLEKVKKARRKKARRYAADQKPHRLEAIAECQESRLKLSKRNL